MKESDKNEPKNNLQSVSLINALNSASRSEYPLSNLITEHALYEHSSNGFENNNNNNAINDESLRKKYGDNLDQDNNFL